MMETLKVALAGLCLAASPALSQVPSHPGCQLEAGPNRAVSSVIDGDTLRLDDGKEVRLLDVLAPKAAESADASVPWPPASASRASLERLALAKTVALAFVGQREDRHGRVLAHVFLPGNPGDAPVWLQKVLIEAGEVRLAPAPASGCARDLSAAERDARSAQRGLWANAAYQVRPADRPGELQRFRSTFQLVSGRITRVSRGRSASYVELATSEQRSGKASERIDIATRIIVPHRLEPGQETKLSLAVGADILVRGWITGRSAPEIAIRSFADVEIEARRDVAPDPPRRRRQQTDPKENLPAETQPGDQSDRR